ncbi:7561_t:CDS:2, partial [Funneliformis mosseae]
MAHSIQKNHNTIEKKFNVKIFDREPSPQDRWQGYHITLHCKGVISFLKCIPESIATRLHEVVPDPIDGGIENHVVTVHDHLGNVLFKTPGYQVKNVYELGIDVQWDKKCVGYHENEEGVWVIFEDGTRGRGDFLVGADGIHSANVATNKELFDRILSITGNSLLQVSMGPKGDCTFLIFRSIPIDSSNAINEFKSSLIYIYLGGK